MFSFTIGSRHFVAVDSSPARTNAPMPGARVGQITADDVVYHVYDDQPPRGGDAGSVAECLTSREVQIAMLIAEGKCDKEIARQLGISSYTVREHLRRIFAKLKVCRRTAVVSWMLRGSVAG